MAEDIDSWFAHTFWRAFKSASLRHHPAGCPAGVNSPLRPKGASDIRGHLGIVLESEALMIDSKAHPIGWAG